MRAGCRLLLQNRAQQMRHRLLPVRPRPPRTGLAVQPDEALLKPFLAPMADRRIGHPQPPRDRGVALPIRRSPADLRGGHALELIPLALAQPQLALRWSTNLCHDPPPGSSTTITAVL